MAVTIVLAVVDAFFAAAVLFVLFIAIRDGVKELEGTIEDRLTQRRRRREMREGRRKSLSGLP